MFANPVGSGQLALNPNFLQTVNFKDLTEEWKKPQVKDIVQAALNLLTARIEKCSRLA